MLACRTQCAAFACLTRSNPAPPVTSRLNGTQGRSGGPDRASWTSSLRRSSRGTSRSLECTLPALGPAGARSQTCSWPRLRWVTKRAAHRIPFTCMVLAHAHFGTSSQNYVGGARLTLAVAGAGGAAGVGLAQRAVGGERRRALVRIARDLRARDRVGASAWAGAAACLHCACVAAAVHDGAARQDSAAGQEPALLGVGCQHAPPHPAAPAPLPVPRALRTPQCVSRGATARCERYRMCRSTAARFSFS